MKRVLREKYEKTEIIPRRANRKFIGILMTSVLLVIISGFVFSQFLPQKFEPKDPYAVSGSGIDIIDEQVYSSGHIIFTAYCEFISYNGFPEPDGDLYWITHVFVCVENDLLNFNASIGEILAIQNASIQDNDTSFTAYESIQIEFTTSFPLLPNSHVYVGVFTLRHPDDTQMDRWDQYATVI